MKRLRGRDLGRGEEGDWMLHTARERSEEDVWCPFLSFYALPASNRGLLNWELMFFQLAG